MKSPRQIYVEICPDTDKVVQVHWDRPSAIKKYSAGTLTRVDRVLKRGDNSGVLVKGHFWAKFAYREGMTFYEVERRALDQTIDLKLRHMCSQISKRDVRSTITKEGTSRLIKKMENYLEVM